MLKGRAEHDLWICAEYVFSPVSMMDVKVNDGDTFYLMMVDGMGNANSHAVENAETRCILTPCMMPRRTYTSEGIIGFAT